MRNFVEPSGAFLTAKRTRNRHKLETKLGSRDSHARNAAQRRDGRAMRRNSATRCNVMLLNDSYGRASRRSSRRATAFVLVKSLIDPLFRGVCRTSFELFCLKCDF